MKFFVKHALLIAGIRLFVSPVHAELGVAKGE
jgi:hypothetical protein